MRTLALLLALLCGGAAQAQLDDARAAYRTGLALRNGVNGTANVVANAALAAQSIARAARAGLPEAMFTWSNMLAAGEGVAPDAPAARSWLEESAALGYAPALQELAMREPDPNRAALLMRQAEHALRHQP